MTDFTNIADLKTWLQEKMATKGRASLRTSIRNSTSLSLILRAHTESLPDIPNMQRVYHILNDLKEVPLCLSCKAAHPKFNSNKWGYLDYCSVKCQANSPAVIKKRSVTLVERYGVDNFAKSDKFKSDAVANNLKKYGCEFYQQTEEFRNKSRQTCLKKYGVDSFSKTDEFRSKMKDSSLSKYGVPHYSQTNDFKKRFKSTSIDKFGYDHPMKSAIVKAAVSNTIYDRHGYPWYVIVPEFSIKGHNLHGFKSKEYYMPSGKIKKIQGYENWALDILLESFNEDDILLGTETRVLTGPIRYNDGGKIRMYTPDILLVKDRRIIEVKSWYTYLKNKDVNELKAEACALEGIDFEFWVFDKDKNLMIIRRMTNS